VLLCEDDAWADRDTGQIVEETSIDWSTQDDADAVPDEGKRHADSVVETTVYAPEWFCLDYGGPGQPCRVASCASCTRELSPSLA